MIVKLIVWCLTTLIDVATFVFFRGAASLIIFALKLLSAPGIAVGGLLDNLRTIFSTIGEYVFAMLSGIISSVISGFFEFVTSAVTGSVELMLDAITEMMQLSKQGLEELFSLIPEIFGGLSEIIGKLVVSVLDNFQDALGSIFDKV